MSTKAMEVYKCDLCGMIVEVFKAGSCPPVLLWADHDAAD